MDDSELKNHHKDELEDVWRIGESRVAYQDPSKHDFHKLITIEEAQDRLISEIKVTIGV